MALADEVEVGGVGRPHLRPGQSTGAEPLLPGGRHELERDRLQGASFGELGQAVQRLQARQQCAGLVHGEADGPVQLQGLADEDVVVLPLDVEQLVGVALRKAGADQDQQIVLKFLAGHPEPVRDVLDVQALVVDQERHQLQHPLELVLRSAFAGPLARPGSADEVKDGTGAAAKAAALASRRCTAVASSAGATTLTFGP